MDRTDHFSIGFSEGQAWAEADKTDGRRQEMLALVRSEATLAVESRILGSAHDSQAAFLLGRARGYRDIARTFERGRWGS